MFVGDELMPTEAPVPAASQQIAAMLPEDLHVVVEGTSTNRLPFLAVSLAAAAIMGWRLFDSMWLRPDLEQFVGGAAIAAAIAGLGALAHRFFVKHRKEFRLTADAVVLEVWHRTDGKPWVTRIPWTEIEDFTVSIDREKAFLGVASVRGYTISLRDEPPRLTTREFIRRFIDEAERHPRAVRPAEIVSGPDDDVEHDFSVIGCLGYAVLAIFGVIGNSLLNISAAQEVAAGVGVVVIALGLYLWNTLDDQDVAHRDGTSKRLMARLRRWLRRVLDIPVT